jgi:hypothetical protein
MENHGAESDDPADAVVISEARQFAEGAVMLLEHPKMMTAHRHSGLYGTAFVQARAILHFVQTSETCNDAEEFDVLLYLIHCHVDDLVGTLSLLRIP